MNIYDKKEFMVWKNLLFKYCVNPNQYEMEENL